MRYKTYSIILLLTIILLSSYKQKTNTLYFSPSSLEKNKLKSVTITVKNSESKTLELLFFTVDFKTETSAYSGSITSIYERKGKHLILKPNQSQTFQIDITKLKYRDISIHKDISTSFLKEKINNSKMVKIRVSATDINKIKYGPEAFILFSNVVELH